MSLSWAGHVGQEVKVIMNNIILLLFKEKSPWAHFLRRAPEDAGDGMPSAGDVGVRLS